MSFLFPQMARANYPHLCGTLHLCRLFSKCWETDHHVCFHSCVRASPLTGLGRTICMFSEKFATNSEFKTLKGGLSGMFSHLCVGCQRGAGMQRPEGQVGGPPAAFLTSRPAPLVWVVCPAQAAENQARELSRKKKSGGRKLLYCQLVFRQVSSLREPQRLGEATAAGLTGVQSCRVTVRALRPDGRFRRTSGSIGCLQPRRALSPCAAPESSLLWQRGPLS